MEENRYDRFVSEMEVFRTAEEAFKSADVCRKQMQKAAKERKERLMKNGK